MKILGICGSPRVNGNTEWALTQLLSACAKNGHITNSVLLSTTMLNICDGSLPKELAPNAGDDIAKIKAEMLAADALVFSTPTYFDNITPQLLNFIARTDPFYEELKGKSCLIIVVGQANDQSRAAAAQYLQTYCAIAEMHVLGQETFRATNKGDIQRIEGITQKLNNLAQQIPA